MLNLSVKTGEKDIYQFFQTVLKMMHYLKQT